MATENTDKKVKVLLAEDEDLFRDLLRVALSRQEQFEVVGSFAEGEAALAAAPHLDPDVAILDIELGTEMNGVQLGLLLRREIPDLGIILLSG